jgi:preprotein translocase subunit SecA
MNSKYEKLVNEINLTENKIKNLSQDELINFSENLSRMISVNPSSPENIINAFGLIKEVSWRTLGLKHFNTQLTGGLILNEGKIVEMKTGEGKTLVSTLPAYYNAASKKGVHVITVNEYLAERDQKWMGEVYRFLNTSVGLVKEQMTEKEKQLNYNCDITYLTNTELGFDYLRDNLAISTRQIVQRPFSYGLIDEVDSILIDEARTPLIISGKSDSYALDKYIQAAEIARFLKVNTDFIIYEKERLIQLTENGINKTQKILKIPNLFDITEPWITYILNALKAKVFFLKDTNYIVQNNKIVSVDEFTGRVMPNRQWNEGIHQSIEAKENVPLSDMNQTIASITYQNLFLLYPKLVG